MAVEDDTSFIAIFQEQLEKGGIKNNAFLEDAIDYKYEHDVHIEVDRYGKFYLRL